MRSKEKVTPRNEILKNFTREFLIEEKRRCEIDRYVCDFRILIHKRPHENHNYLSRLLQDYTTMFLSHERISANKMNQEDLKYQVKTQLTSRKKQTPKQRYVKSKLSKKSDNLSEHQSYLVLKAQTEEFVKTLRSYEELEQIAYEIFIKNTNSVSKTYQYEMEDIIQPNTVLKLKSSEVPQDIPYKKHYRNVYVVNSPAATGGNSVVNKKIQNQNSESKSLLENYEHIKKETELFLQNNKNYNDAERKMLTEQYRTNTYIRKYVDSLTSSEKPKKSTHTPKKGLYSKIKNMMGFSPENPTKFYKNVENTSGVLLDNTEIFLANERKYNNFEFEAYKLFYIKNEEFQNPLIEKIKNNAYESEIEPSGSARKIKIKHLVGLKNAKTNQRNQEKDEFEDFNLVKCSPNEIIEPEQKIRDITFQFDAETPKIGSENYTITNVSSTNEQEQVLQQFTADFLKRQKIYEDKQRYFYVIHLRRHNINLKKEKKETLLLKIKHLFFGRHEKSKENLNYSKEITREFLRNEQYFYGLQKQAHHIFSEYGSNYSVLRLRPFEVNSSKSLTNERIIPNEPKKSTKNNESHQRSSVETAIEKKNLREPQTPTKKDKNKSIGKSGTLKKQEKSKMSVTPLHQRSQSEDLLMFRTKTKSLDNRKSPTGHKTFSDRLKSMVGITNRRKTKSRENILSLTDPVHYFLEHERFYYEGVPQNGEKYGRSVSAIESTPKDGTLKTKTRRFLSTENVLYQDSNGSSIGKPPTGRRRKQERNRDSKEKRRSRTLSPAQKLVSKIRNLVQKSPDKKKEDPAVIAAQTDKFLSDHRTFNDVLGASFSYTKLKDEPSNIDDTIQTTYIAEKSPSSNKILPPSMDETKVKSSHQMQNKATSSIIPLNSIKDSEDINEKSNISKDYQHIKTKTEEFVHDIKRYHDLDKNPDAMDKTLIFINNKSDYTPVVTQHIENTPGRQKTVLVKSMNVETVNDHSTLKTEQQTEFENTQSNSSFTNNNTQKIIQNSYVQQTRITQRVTTEKVQRKTTKEIFSREIDSKNINGNTQSTLSSENEHTYENVTISGVTQKNKIPLISENEIISTGKVEDRTIFSGDLINAATNLSIRELKTENEEVNDHAYENVVFTAPTEYKELVTPKSEDYRFNTIIEIEEKVDNRKKIEILDPKKSDSHKVMSIKEKSVQKEKHTEISNLCGKKKRTDEVKRNSEIQNLKSQKAAQSRIIPPSRPNRRVESSIAPQHFSKSKIASDDQKNTIIRDQTDEFLRKHQYLIHKEEVVLPKVQALSVVDNQKISVETAPQQSSAPKRIDKSPEKEQKPKKTAFSKLKTFVSGTSKKPTAEETNIILRQQTSEFLDNVRKSHDEFGEANAKYRVVWLTDQQNKPSKAQASIIEESKPITLTEDEKKKLRLIRQNTDIFLKDHQDYHNKQRSEDNAFFTKMGQPETFIWLTSKPIKKGDNIITKVKNLMSPQRTKKNITAADDQKNKIIRDQTDEFLRKHQYLIHKEEVVLPKVQALSVVDNQKISVETAPKQSSAPTRIEKSPEKEQKPKKTAFSKLKTFVSGTSKKPTAEETNILLRNQTSEFLDNVRRSHDESEEANAKYRVVWLSDQQNKPSKSQASIIEESKPITLTEDEKKKLRLIRQNTDIFLKDHQDYHNKQRSEDNAFFTKMGQRVIWLSSRPIKKGDNIITKVKNLMSPQRTKKNITAADDQKNKIIRDQTDEFLRKHQYLIHKEEVVLPKVQALSVVDNQKISVETAPKQSSAPKRIEKSPEKEQKPKKTAFSKLKTFVSGTSKKPTAEETNILLRNQTSEFLDNVRRSHDESEEANAKYRVVWLSDQQNKPSKSQASIIEESKPITLTEDEKKKLRLIRQNTDIFLKDHQDYHNKQRSEDNAFFTKMGQRVIWLSSRPIKKGDNIITKVKNLMSPQRTKKNITAADDQKNKIIRDQTDEFLRKHQYLIHKEEVVLPKVQALSVVDNQKISVETAPKQSSAPKRIEKSPEKEQKPKKTAFSKLKTFVSGTSKKPTAEETNILLRNQTSEFLDNVRRSHDESEEANAKYRVVWLSDQQNKPSKAQASIIEESKPITLTEDEKKKLRLIRQNTDIFLKDHQDYHNKQRSEDNAFFTKMGQRETFIWLSSRPIKKGDNIITKVKNLMSPQRTKKNITAADDQKNKIIRDQTDEFLRKHQYLIHKEEVVLPKVQALSVVDNQKISVETAPKQSSAPTRIEKSPEKEQKPKKTAFSKLKTFVSGTSKKPTAEETNILLRNQTSEFLDNVRRSHDESEEANAKYRVVWLSDQQNKPSKAQASIIEESKPITLTEDEKKKLRLIRQNTDIFLKDHQDYHNKQRSEDNAFFTKMGQPETFIWLSSRPIKKGDNIITKVKNLMSPQRTKKDITAADDQKNKIIRDQTDEFLRKHQYLIHKEEVVLPKVQALSVVDTQKISVETAPKQSSAPKRIEKSPEKEQKPKKTAFSKLKTFVSGTSKKPTAEETNILLRNQTSEFLDNVRRSHDESEEANAKYRVVWLSDQQNKPSKAQASIIEESKPITLTEDEKKKLRLIRQNTDIFLKDHQDYHNKQRSEDNAFFTKMGQPETFIWLSSRPIKKGDNIITKMKNLMSPQRTKKNITAADDQKNKIIRDQTDEFLRKHQYLIHKEEVVLPKVQALSVVDKQKISVETAPKQSSAPKRIEKSPEKEQKPKKTAFSKLKTFVSGTSKKPTAEETNILLRNQTSEFLDNVRRSHDESEEANAKYRVVWLSDQQNKPSKSQASIIEESKPITLTEHEKKKLRLIRQNTDIFLKDHQDYHNKQRSEDNAFFTKMGQPETFIWLSSRPIKKGDNIITKVKNLMSPQRTKKNITAADDQKNKIIRDQTDEFLRKHQYLIHKEEVVLPKVQALSVVDNQKISVETAPKQSSAPKRIEKSPEKEQKPKKTAFSKLKTFVSGTSKKPTAEETNILLRNQTSEFLDNVRRSHDESEEANAKYRVVWLSDQQNKPSKAQASIIEESKPITLTEDEKKKLRLIRQNTDIFLKDHQDYHNKQRSEDNAFFTKMGQPETFIWLSSRPIKKGDNIITKVKNLMSPQRTKKNITAADDQKNKIIRDQTDEFLRKHQYLIHKEEVVLPKVQALSVVDNQKISVETAPKQSSAPKRIEKSPEKEQKPKKTAFSKLKTFVSGTSKKPTAEETNILLRNQTSEFLDNVRRSHDESEEANAKYRVVWLSDQQNKPSKAQASIIEESKPITLTEDEKKKLRLIRQNTDIFLKDHQDYHNKQRSEDNAFFTKMGQPETFIWLSSRPIKKGDNIITKVKNLMSPQRTKKNITAADDQKNKIIRDQTDEFLRKHQYLIHKEEVVLPKVQALSVVDNQKISVETAPKQSSAPKRIEKSPEKEQKPKKTAFSKLKTFVSGTSKKPTAEETNILLRNQTSEFLDNVRRSHDESEEANAKYRVVWLSDQQNKPSKAQASIIEESKPITLTEDEKKKLRLIRQNTDIFLKDHQDYHNKQRSEDNAFFTKMGQPETFIWLSSRPIKKGDNIITKVKNLMSPQRTKKNITAADDQKNKIIRDQTDEFLRKHQYLIHKEEVVLPKVQALSVVDNQKISVETAPKQSSAPKRIEKSPEKEQKPKKTAFSKLKTFVSGTSKKPTAEETNILLRNQTSEFLDNVRRSHDESEEANAKYRVVWLSDQQNKPSKAQASIIEESKPITLTEDEKKKLRLIRQNTDIFLKDHQDYHNKQRSEDNAFFTKMGQPETFIWLSSRPIKKGDNIITKVKNLMSPQRTKKNITAADDQKNKIIRDQTDEFLRKHQYLIHKEEVVLPKVQALSVVDKQKISVETAPKQSSAPKRIEKSPEKEQKPKKTAFSKLKTFVSGTSKKPTAEETNILLRQQTSEFLDNVRKSHDESEEANAKYRVVWLSDQQNKPSKAHSSIIEESKPVTLTEDEKKKLRLIRQNTDIFLKDHQDYHNKQRREDYAFFTKMGQPETFIWLTSRPIKKGDNIITKVKNLMSPQRTKKNITAADDQKNKIIRDKTDEFLRKHQYLIHKEEVVLPKVQALSVVDTQKISVETAPKQSSAPKRIEKSPEKEQKPKKTAFSKLKTFVSGTSKKPTAEETNILLRNQTSGFLDNVRRSHDESEEANAKYRVVWLSDQQNKPSKAQASIIEESKPITLTEDEKKKLRLIRQNTDIFLKDHQDYHNKQRSEDNAFFTKMGQPETLIWLSARPIKKGDNIITKVKNSMSPQRTKKNIAAADDQKNKIIRDQTDEFLRKHQYLIHKEEVVLPKVQALSVVDKQKISVETAPKQSSAPKRIEKSPEKEQKPKKTAFSKLKTFVSGTSKKPTAEETNILLRNQTSEFLDNVRRSHDESEEANAKYRVVWLSDQQNKPSKAQASIKEESKPITLTEDEKKKLRLIRQNTDIFLKDHQGYHNKLHTENSKTLIKTRTVSEDAFVTPITKSPDDSKLKEIIKVVPLTKVDSEDSIKNNEKTSRKNIVSKVKDIISPHKSSGAVFYYDIRDEIAGKNENSKMLEQKKEPVKCLESEEYLCPPPRHIKKVTFSQKKDMEEQSDNIPRGDYSTGSYDAIKPQAAPRKQIAKKVKTMFIDSAEIFKQNKESNLIPETDKFLKDHKSHQNKQWAQHSINNKQVKNSEEDPVHTINNPEPTFRTEHIGYSSKITQPNTLETRLDKTYAENRRMLVLFLDDHKAHHEKERIQFINFISKQNKPGECERKTTGKEPKLKNKLMSKFKSLVGQSQENIASDMTRQNEIALRKQTSEFLISQKCYNDLECNAYNKFSVKQLEIEKLHKIHTAGDQLIADAPEKLSSNSKLSLQEDSTFSTRKLSLNGSPETTSSQKPLKSSPDKKISMTDDTTVIKIIDSQTNDNTGTIHSSPSTDYISSLEHNINFLNDQRNYINSENETWRQYLKYEPVKVLKATNDTREEYTKKSSRVQYSMPKPKDPPRKSSSQIESEKIDHEVTLHQTKLFMENHKSFHDNLQNELSKYVPKETKMNYCEETVLGKDQGVLTKIKSLITLGPAKSRSYEVNKPAVSTQKYTHIQINEMNESGNIAQPSKEIDNDFREITKNFLEDHQEYHNQQRLYSTDKIRQGEEKEKKNKKGVFSKIKSYMVGDTNKKTSKTSSNAPTTIEHSDEMVQTVPITEAEVLIRELESSPRTSRRNRPRNIQYEELQISKREPNDSKISSNIVPVETRENVNPSSLKPHQTTALEGMEADDMNKSLSKNLYYDEIKVLPKEERKKFAKDKINTQDFLLNEKRFTEIVGSKIEHDTIQYQKDSVLQNTVTGQDIPSIESNITDTLGVMTRNQDEKQIKTRAEHQPSAPSLNELSGGEKENKQPVIQRLVKPMSPTKTIFKEIREREESPDRKVYVMKEGYIITKGNTDDIKSTKNDLERKAVQRKTLSSSFGDRPRMEDQDFHERGEKKSGNLEPHIDGSSIPDSNKTTEGQDYVDRSNDSPSRLVPQGDLEVRRHHTKNCYFIFIVVLVVLIAIYCLREDENNN